MNDYSLKHSLSPLKIIFCPENKGDTSEITGTRKICKATDLGRSLYLISVFFYCYEKDIKKLLLVFFLSYKNKVIRR